jgi:hypothetical protein
MLREGLEIIESVRRRFDGERRNPWDEPECGHHYARAMSAWSTVVAFSGFRYHAGERAVSFVPKTSVPSFASFFSVGSGWGLCSIRREAGHARVHFALKEGSLAVRSVRLALAAKGPAAVSLNNRRYAHTAAVDDGMTILRFEEDLVVPAGGELAIAI